MERESQQIQMSPLNTRSSPIHTWTSTTSLKWKTNSWASYKAVWATVMSKSHISAAVCKIGKARTYFQFLPGDETVTISIIKAVNKFTAFQLQSAKSAPYIITQSSQKWQQGPLRPSETNGNGFLFLLLSERLVRTPAPHRRNGKTSTPREQPLEADLSQWQLLTWFISSKSSHSVYFIHI